MQLYHDWVAWYGLVDPVEEHAEEAAAFAAVLIDAMTPPAGVRPTLLELGAGAGNNGWFLKSQFDCTLTDLAPSMLDRSRAQNPECAHAEGDMRTLRLGCTFDAVLVHDAVVYMTTRDDLQAAARTAFVHLRPGGAALFVTDCTRESFAEGTELIEGDDPDRAVRLIAWMWDPDPTDERYRVDYAGLLRQGDQMQLGHDQHEEGLFSEATWVEILESVGFAVEVVARPLPEEEQGGYYTDVMFLARRLA